MSNYYFKQLNCPSVVQLICYLPFYSQYSNLLLFIQNQLKSIPNIILLIPIHLSHFWIIHCINHGWVLVSFSWICHCPFNFLIELGYMWTCDIDVGSLWYLKVYLGQNCWWTLTRWIGSQFPLIIPCHCLHALHACLCLFWFCVFASCFSFT